MNRLPFPDIASMFRGFLIIVGALALAVVGLVSYILYLWSTVVM